MAITKCKTLRSLTNTADKDGRTGLRVVKLWYGTVAEAEAYIGANIPPTITTFDGVVMNIESVDVTSDEHDEEVHTGRISYSSSPRREPSAIGSEVLSFDISPVQVKADQSLQTIASYAAAGETAPNFYGGINYRDGQFEGADRYDEAFSFTVTKVLANSSITNAYISTLRDTCFRWNAAAYRGLPAGEVLLVGASGSPRDAKSYSVGYKFFGSRNVTGLTSGGISGISKQGWDYLWHLRREMEDTTAKFITPRPIAAYVERLYTSANFQVLLGLQ